MMTSNPRQRQVWIDARRRHHLSHAHVLIYGILVVIVILFMPDGVLGFFRKFGARRRTA